MPTPLVILAWIAGTAAVALTVLIDALSRARRLRHQRELRDLAALSWQQFEEVIADAFRRHGYRVREVGGRGRADGGVDLILTREGQTTVVQAKHWRSNRVGVQLVRELYGVQRAMQADHAMFGTRDSHLLDHVGHASPERAQRQTAVTTRRLHERRRSIVASAEDRRRIAGGTRARHRGCRITVRLLAGRDAWCGLVVVLAARIRVDVAGSRSGG